MGVLHNFDFKITRCRICSLKLLKQNDTIGRHWASQVVNLNMNSNDLEI